MRGVALLAVLLMPVAAQAWPRDHLKPWRPVADFREEKGKTFQDAFAAKMRLFGTVDAPMDKQVAIGMEVEDGRYSIVTWTVDEGASAKPSCEAGIAAPLGAKIDRAWRLMIEDARDEVRADGIETVGVDGIFFFFARNDGGKLDVASAWTPDEDTKPQALVDVMSAMSEFCDTPGKSVQDRLDRQTSALLDALQPPP